MQPRTGRRLRDVHIACPSIKIDRRPDGTTYVNNTSVLGPYPVSLTDCLDHWAAVVDVQVFDREVGVSRALELVRARL